MLSQIVASESITQAYLLPTKSEDTISEEFVKSIWSLYIEWNANCLKYSLANEYFRQLAFHSIYKDQIDFTNSSEIVSSDLVGSRYACVIDSEATICDNKQVVIYAWYDNELGYCVQLLRVIKSLAGIKYNRLPYFL